MGDVKLRRGRGRRATPSHARSKKKMRKLKTRALVLSGHTGGIVTEQRKLGTEIARQRGKNKDDGTKEAKKIVQELKVLHPGNLRLQAEECQKKRLKLLKKRKARKKKRKKKFKQAASDLAKELTSVMIKL